jgi:hypothetical protein
MTSSELPAKKPGGFRRFLRGRFLIVSIALHMLFGGIATLWVVQTMHANRKLTFKGGPPSPNPSTRALEHQVQMAKKQNTMSAPAMPKRITTAGLAKVTLPDMPAMPTLTDMKPTKIAGMGGTGVGLGVGGFGRGGGAGGGGGGMFMSSIGGMKVRAQKLAVALDVSGSVKEYQTEMHEYVKSTFKGSEVAEFKSAGFYPGGGKGISMGQVVLDFLKSPKHFDTIYIFSDFGETKDEQSQWAEVQTLIKAQKVRLYLHVLREPGKEKKINPVLADVIDFAKKSGGDVKVGPMQHIKEKDAPK